MVRIAIAALLLAGCAPVPRSMSADVAITAIRGGKLFSCDVRFGWSLDTLKSVCGEPDAIIDWANLPGSKCAIYSNEGNAFRGGRSAPRIAVCLVKRTRSKGSVSAEFLEVSAVYGLVDEREGAASPSATTAP